MWRLGLRAVRGNLPGWSLMSDLNLLATYLCWINHLLGQLRVARGAEQQRKHGQRRFVPSRASMVNGAGFGYGATG
jgi:hypothetical protein